jgi:hypothetical protein
MKTILKLMLLQLTLAGGVMAWQKFPHLSGNYGLATIRNIGWGGPSQSSWFRRLRPRLGTPLPVEKLGSPWRGLGLSYCSDIRIGFDVRQQKPLKSSVSEQVLANENCWLGDGKEAEDRQEC